MIGLVSGTTYYYTVTASGSTTPAQSAEFTYDSSLETVEVIVAGATYDYYNDKLTWNSSGTIAQFKVEVYSADDNTLVRTLYTTNNYISGDEAFQDTGNYYYKVRIVDASGNNVGDTNYWYYCPSDSTYGFSATVKVTFDACAGYFDGDETKKQITLKVDRNTCKVEAFPFDNVFMYGEVINGYYTELGYQIYEDHEFYEDTILYAHYDDCDHTTSTTSATCEEDAICSVCGMTLSAKGHNYAGGVCVNCGEAEPSEDEGSTSVTVSDSENSEILSQVIDTNTVGSATISIDTTGSAAAGSTGTLTLSSVASTVSSLTFDGSTTGSSITLSPETSANITIGETLTGKETTTSGDETSLSGTVLFYGDLSYSSLNVSGATITLSLTVNGTVDPDSVVLLHNGTSGWERLDSSTVTNNGTLTITGTLTGLSPIMVLTVEADEPTVDYGTVWVGNIELSDGEYTTDGSTKTAGTPTGSGYAYFNNGVLYLNSFTYTTSNTSATDDATISTTSSELTISLYGDNTIGGENYGIRNRNGVVNIVLTDTTVPGSLALQPSTTGSYSRGIYCVGAVTIDGVSLTVSANDHSICSMSSSITIKNEAVLEADCTLSATGDITIENSMVAITTTSTDGAISAENLSITASDVTADGGISVSYFDFEKQITVYGAITLTPDTDKTLDVTLGTSGTPTSYSSATTLSGETWLNYSYIKIAQADASGGTSHTHTYTSEVTTAATCTENGVKTYTCTVCGETYTEEIQATGHSYKLYENEDATCTASGYEHYVCEACLDDYTVTLPATGHSWDSPTFDWAEDYSTCTAIFTCENDSSHVETETATVESVTTAAKCTEDGKTVYTAKVTFNGIEYTDTQEVTIPATGHNYEAVVTAPTCTEQGYTTYTCSVCGDSYIADETPALGHHVEGDRISFNWDYGDVTVTVLCSRDCGTVLYSGDADEVKSEYSNPTCTTNGFTTYTATYYNDISDQTYYNTFVITDAGSATGHTWDEGTVNINATCDTPGSITYTCEVCGETYTEEIPATGHSYEAVVTAPTCTEKGYTTYTCSVCGDSYIADETEATGHSYTESYLWDDDFTSCTVTLTCKNCDEVVEYVSATDDEVTITEVDGLFTVTLIHDGMTYSTSVQTYTVTWIDGDGNEIQVDSRLLEGATVSYSGSTPTKASDNTYSYTFAGWDKDIETVSGNTTYKATFTASAHNYVATFSWADDLKSATVTLTCSDCDHTVTIDSSDVTIKAVNNLGLVTRTATAEFNGVTYTDSVTTGVSLLVIPADYTSVNLAIARANGLDSSSYTNFADVTTAINAVQWGMNVLNQATVNAYAEAINTAIDNLEAIETVLVEETVEIDEPIEGTDTDTEPDDVNVGDNTETEPDTNPTTGIALALLPMALAMAGAVANKRR